MAERTDNIGFGNLKLIQDTDEFCYGVDAVILSEFAASTAKKCDSILDLGTGTGVIPLILSHKTCAKRIEGIEVQKSQYEKALRNIKLNRLEERVSFKNMNVTDIKNGEFDIVTCNPPYAKAGSSIVSFLNAKAVARHEILAGLDDFFKAAYVSLKDKGEFFMVHRPSRLADIFVTGRKYHLEPKTMRLVSPRENEEPNIVLIHFIKGAGSQLKVLSPLYVYGNDGKYSEEILKIYEK